MEIFQEIVQRCSINLSNDILNLMFPDTEENKQEYLHNKPKKNSLQKQFSQILDLNKSIVHLNTSPDDIFGINFSMNSINLLYKLFSCIYPNLKYISSSPDTCFDFGIKINDGMQGNDITLETLSDIKDNSYNNILQKFGQTLFYYLCSKPPNEIKMLMFKNENFFTYCLNDKLINSTLEIFSEVFKERSSRNLFNFSKLIENHTSKNYSIIPMDSSRGRKCLNVINQKIQILLLDDGIILKFTPKIDHLGAINNFTNFEIHLSFNKSVINAIIPISKMIDTKYFQLTNVKCDTSILLQNESFSNKSSSFIPDSSIFPMILMLCHLATAPNILINTSRKGMICDFTCDNLVKSNSLSTHAFKREFLSHINNRSNGDFYNKYIEIFFDNLVRLNESRVNYMRVCDTKISQKDFFISINKVIDSTSSSTVNSLISQQKIFSVINKGLLSVNSSQNFKRKKTIANQQNKKICVGNLNKHYTITSPTLTLDKQLLSFNFPNIYMEQTPISGNKNISEDISILYESHSHKVNKSESSVNESNSSHDALSSTMEDVDTFSNETNAEVPSRKSVFSRLSFPSDSDYKTEPKALKSYELPFVSTNEEENTDLNDPKWSNLRNLKSDQERYKAIKELWKNTEISDPDKDLTYHSYRRRFQKVKKESSASATDAALDCNNNKIGNDRKRQREFDPSDPALPAKKRQKRFTNMDFHRRSIKVAESRLNDEYNRFVNFLTPNSHYNRFVKVTARYHEYKNQFNNSKVEAEVIQKFYRDLPGQEFRSQRDIEEEQLDVERVINSFKLFYGWSGRIFNPGPI